VLSVSSFYTHTHTYTCTNTIRIGRCSVACILFQAVFLYREKGKMS